MTGPWEPPSQWVPGSGTEAGGADVESERETGSRAARRRQRSAPVRRRRRVVAGLFALVVVLGCVFVTWYELETHALGAAGKAEIVQIHAGESVSAVASSLSSEHVIGNTLAFRLYDLVHGDPTITAGAYLFHQNLTFGQVHQLLNGGTNVSAVTVYAGFTLHEIAQRVGDLPGHSASAFEQLAVNGSVRSVFEPAGSSNLEGMLGSGTYLVLPGESDASLLTAMVTRFDHQAETAGLSTATASALGLTPYQLITAASVVEKEGYYPKNMPDVARVIYNRLANGTPLQMDSTVLYALGQDGGTVTPQDLQIQSPYNSYLNLGLPPTPICSPSPIALSAAVHPPAGAWLYFVVIDKSGDEAFSDTFDQQLANEHLAQARGVG
jgi:UPF0755 protein